MEQEKPDCYACAHRRTIPGNIHSRCNNLEARTSGSAHGIRNGWFRWPVNFDPVWLETCDGFSTREEDRTTPIRKLDPMLELLGLLG